MKPSFYTLYKQGRFRAGTMQNGIDEGMQQIERFAVAMVGFALQHDEAFCRAFCRNICGITLEKGAFPIPVDVEVDGLGDLELQVGNRHCFIEFKVEAPLDPKQDPQQDQFRQVAGYGHNIQRRHGRNGTYIVLRNDPIDLSRKDTNPDCKAKTWRDLRMCNTKSKLIDDLFQSLGSLKVAEFIYMNTTKLTLGNAAGEACKLYTLLDAVESKAFKTKSKTKTELEPSATGGSVGKYFHSNDARWKNLLNTTERTLGWFGYEDTDLSIWLYCGDQKTANRVKQSLDAGSKPTAVIKVESETEVSIKLRGNDSSGDQEWFLSVFDYLVPPHRKSVVKTK